MNISNITESVFSRNLNGFYFAYGTVYGGSMILFVESEYIKDAMKSLYSEERFFGEKRTGLCDFEQIEISLDEYAMDLFSGFDNSQKTFILNAVLDSYKEFGCETKGEWVQELNETHYKYLSQLKAKKISSQVLSTISNIIS